MWQQQKWCVGLCLGMDEASTQLDLSKNRLQRESCHWQWPLVPFLLYSTSVKMRGAEQHWWSCSFWSGRRSRWGLLQTDWRSLMLAGSDPHGGLYLSWYPLVEHHNKAWAMPWRVHRWQIPKKDEQWANKERCSDGPHTYKHGRICQGWEGPGDFRRAEFVRAPWDTALDRRGIHERWSVFKDYLLQTQSWSSPACGKLSKETWTRSLLEWTRSSWQNPNIKRVEARKEEESWRNTETLQGWG